MKKWKTEEMQIKILFFVSVIILIAILIPLFWIAHYNFMSVDDFSLAKSAESVWEESHSIISVFLSQLSYAKYMYFNWQGTFFSIWLSSSILGMFGKSAYYIGAYLCLGGFVLAELFLFYLI